MKKVGLLILFTLLFCNTVTMAQLVEYRKEMVYNLEVDDPFTYVAGGFIVH